MAGSELQGREGRSVERSPPAREELTRFVGDARNHQGVKTKRRLHNRFSEKNFKLSVKIGNKGSARSEEKGLLDDPNGNRVFESCRKIRTRGGLKRGSEDRVVRDQDWDFQDGAGETKRSGGDVRVKEKPEGRREGKQNGKRAKAGS